MGLNREQLRRRVAEVKGLAFAAAEASDNDEYEVRWSLTRGVLRELKEMADSLSCDHELAVSYAIRYAARAHREGNDIRSRI